MFYIQLWTNLQTQTNCLPIAPAPHKFLTQKNNAIILPPPPPLTYMTFYERFHDHNKVSGV